MEEIIKNLPEGHPVSVFNQENNLIRKLLAEVEKALNTEDIPLYINVFNQLSSIEKHFARKENQLFPYLEKHGWNGPSQGMWSFHDNLREQIRILRGYIEEQNTPKITENSPILVEGILRLLEIEEGKLFPNAMNLLSKDEWKDMRKGDEEIGWMLSDTPVAYPTQEAYIHPSEDITPRELPFSIEDKTHYDEGYMSPEQVNLLLKVMPVDITFVDENDRVIFYNRGEERVFPRSAGIIGREVKFCHPPHSVDKVLRIVSEFKKGTQSEAAFWFNFKERMIYVRYFAVRDENKNYKGVVEMSEDVTDIKKLEGEQRLLDWD